MEADDRFAVMLDHADLALLCEALDIYEYWELGAQLPRNNGMVFIPGDSLALEDPYWDGREPTPGETEDIEAVLECPALAERLTELKRTNS